MSHSVTITRTTTSTSNTSYIVLNTGYLKSFTGILKLLQLLIGIAVVILISLDIRGTYPQDYILFHYLMSTTFMIGTFCLLLACLTSLSTGGLIGKTIYELIYHSVAGILLLASSLAVVIKIGDQSRYLKNYMAAGVLGLINCVLYFISSFLAHRSYRGI